MDYRKEVMKNAGHTVNDPIEQKLALCGLGIAGEAGEVADRIKKMLFHGIGFGVKLDFDTTKKLMNEMGDVYWYLELLCNTLGITREEVMQANIDKLNKRHPNGWTPESQRAKADEVKT